MDTDFAAASDGTAAQTDVFPVNCLDGVLIDMTGADSASPAKKPKARAPKAKSPADSKAKGTKTVKDGAAGKLKGRTKKTEALEALAPEELPRGPSFPFDINRVLALGRQCGLPTESAARDELAGQHGVLHSLDAGCQTAVESASAVPSAKGGTADSVMSTASAQADCFANSLAYSNSRMWGCDCAEEQQASVGPASSQEVPLSELSLRERLQKVQCLLQQAGLSPAEAMLGLGLTNPDALDAANASPAVRGRHVSGEGSDLFHAHVGCQSSTHGPDQAGAGMHIGLDCSPVPNLAHGVTYDDLINLISPTPGPSPQASDAGTDNSIPPRPRLLAPQLGPLKVDPPSQCNDMLVCASSPLALISHVLLQQQEQQQHDECVVKSANGPISSGKVGQNSLDSTEQEPPLQGKATCFQQGQSAASPRASPAASPATSPTVAEQPCDGLQLTHGVQSSASCQQSPGSSVDEVSQHGKKRSRSATTCPFMHRMRSSDLL